MSFRATSGREIIGRNCRFLQGPDADPEAVRRIRQAVAAVQPIEIDLRNRRKNGEPFWNRLLISPVFDSAGRLTYFIASQVDLSFDRERLTGLETNNATLMAELTGRLHAQQEREREDGVRHAGRGVRHLEPRVRDHGADGLGDLQRRCSAAPPTSRSRTWTVCKPSCPRIVAGPKPRPSA